MNDITLITVNDVKEYSNISKHISPDKLEPIILEAEQLFVYDVLGEELTLELKNQLTGNTLTNLNITLLNSYIKPLAVKASILKATFELPYQFVQIGLVKQSSENSESLTENELTMVRQDKKDSVMFNQERLRKYLEKNRTSYPLYKSDCNNNEYNSIGIYLGQ